MDALKGKSVDISAKRSLVSVFNMMAETLNSVCATEGEFENKKKTGTCVTFFLFKFKDTVGNNPHFVSLIPLALLF